MFSMKLCAELYGERMPLISSVSHMRLDGKVCSLDSDDWLLIS